MMDRALQERIIGAAVLVLVMVLVVPVFLDGPDDDAQILTERVPLPGQAEQETRTVVLDRDRTEPVPSKHVAPEPVPAKSPPPDRVQPSTETQETKAEPVEKPAVEAKPADSPKAEVEPAAETSATGMWAVQLGSFSNEANAERLAANLRKQGHAAFLSHVSTADGPRHRVRIGPQKDRDAADAVAARLKSEGHDVKVLPHP
jgi:DedD protein